MKGDKSCVDNSEGETPVFRHETALPSHNGINKNKVKSASRITLSSSPGFDTLPSTNSSSSSSSSAKHTSYFLSEPGTFLQHLDQRSIYGRRQLSAAYPSIARKYVRPKNTQQLFAKSAWSYDRLQNMILAVGPNTPASKFITHDSDNSSSDDDNNSQSSVEMDEEDQDDSDDDLPFWASEAVGGPAPVGQNFELEEIENDQYRLRLTETSSNTLRADMANPPSVLRAIATMASIARQNQQSDNENDSRMDVNANNSNNRSDDDGSNEPFGVGMNIHDPAVNRARRTIHYNFSNNVHISSRLDLDADNNPSSSTTNNNPHENNCNNSYMPRIVHGGCINTACWMDVPWRFSMAAQGFSAAFNIVSDNRIEESTQLLTSGDDRMIRVWDLRDSMGMANPMPGGWDSLCPFSGPNKPDPNYVDGWRNHFKERPYAKLPGRVKHIASINTKHRGNVFHVSPIPLQPGKVLSSGADGFLRLVDLDTDQSMVVFEPLIENVVDSILAGMIYAHTLTGNQTGLICCEKGLFRFDLRLSAREQSRTNLFQFVSEYPGYREYVACKACAVWSPWCDAVDYDEPRYVFAGGVSDRVALFDTRMEGSQDRANVVHWYKPRDTFEDKSSASVSGLDISKDKQRLLVSYESDQIYEFSIMPKYGSVTIPTSAETEVDSYGTNQSKSMSLDMAKHDNEGGKIIHELGCYGGHFNRYTFLKAAKYAGPNDEYICTGSDSGHAWIFETKSASVASFFSADTNTCNGVIPHPTLPYFVTYGINSTAKLWRASTPVDLEVDDSSHGRVKAYLSRSYEMTNCCKSWSTVQSVLHTYGKLNPILPDTVATMDDMKSASRVASLLYAGSVESDKFRIRNSMRILPDELRLNLHEAIEFKRKDSLSVPIDHDVQYFSHRLGYTRLRHQADSLGLQWDYARPWAFINSRGTKVHPADLLPDFPSDWIMLDYTMCGQPSHGPFSRDFDEALTQLRYGKYMVKSGTNTYPLPWKEDWKKDDEYTLDWPGEVADQYSLNANIDKKQVQIFLYETILVLKNGGNDAMKEADYINAARRYDKGIRYCAIAVMSYEGYENLDHLHKGQGMFVKKGKETQYVVTKWSIMLQTLVQLRLNLSLVLLKLSTPVSAVRQAKFALELLEPFIEDGGQIFSMKDKGTKSFEDLKSDYNTALVLNAKANFRLGCAYMELNENEKALTSFKVSLKDTPEESYKEITKKIQQVKTRIDRQKKRESKPYKRLWQSDTDKNETKQQK